MKNIFRILLVIAFVFAVIGRSAYADDKPYSMKTDEELTKDEAVTRIAEWTAKVNDLNTKIKTMDGDIDKLKKDIDDSKAQLKNCRDAYYSLIGASDLDIQNFRQQLGVIEGRIRDMQRLSDDVLADKQDEVKALENDLNQLRKSKISVLPEFYNRIIDDARAIKGLYREKKIKSYTVGTWAENRDCLWNIAGKMEIYGDPFMWPKIWQNNTELVHNPDIIHPGQVLKLPPAGPKTSEELKAERKYWRLKIAAQEEEGKAGMPVDKKAPAEPQKGQKIK